jgi:hypothetical protein
MAINQRWIWYDPSTSDEWVVPMNPNKMTSPHAPKNTVLYPKSERTHGRGEGGGGVARIMQFRQNPYEWSFSGVIRSEQHFHDLMAWSKKTSRLHITDHLERTWEVRMDSIDIDEQRDTARNPWRFTYTVKVNIYGRVA